MCTWSKEILCHTSCVAAFVGWRYVACIQSLSRVGVVADLNFGLLAAFVGCCGMHGLLQAEWPLARLVNGYSFDNVAYRNIFEPPEAGKQPINQSI